MKNLLVAPVICISISTFVPSYGPKLPEIKNDCTDGDGQIGSLIFFIHID